MFKLKGPRDERGVSEVLGAILVLGMVIAVGSVLYGGYVQSSIHTTEVNFMRDVRGTFIDLQSAISTMGAGQWKLVSIPMSPNFPILVPTSGEMGTVSFNPGQSYLLQSGHGSSYQNIVDRITGSFFIAPYDGWANSITVYIAHYGYSGQCMLRAAIYGWSDESGDYTNLVGQTNEVMNPYNGWVTLHFPSPQSLTAGTTYYLVAWAGDVDQGGYVNLYYDNSSGKGIYYNASYPPFSGDFDNIPLSWQIENREYSIYCYYTPLPLPTSNYSTTDNKPTFTWARGVGADNHRIEVDNTDDTFTHIVDNHVVTKPNDNTWSKSADGDNGYKSGTYYWRVWAHSAYGDYVSANTWTFTILR
jgi:hypothetical protein